jgi:hypothetical protein
MVMKDLPVKQSRFHPKASDTLNTLFVYHMIHD